MALNSIINKKKETIQRRRRWSRWKETSRKEIVEISFIDRYKNDV